MSAFGELECTCTRKAVKETYPINKGKYIIGRCSKDEIQANLSYYDRLPGWVRQLIEGAEYSISLRSKAMGSESSYISRAQIWLEVTDEFAKVVDLHSKNKTFVNGSQVRSTHETYEVRYVFPEDLVSIGSGAANLRYRMRKQESDLNPSMPASWSEEEGDLEILRNSL